MDEHSPRRSRRLPRLRAIPPALLSSGEPFEGYQILLEVPGEPGVTIWQLLRDVTLWAATPPGSRGEPFAGAEGQFRREILGADDISESIRPYLLIAAGALEAPPKASPEELVTACRRVVDWAAEQRLPRTAVAFAQAAALAWPESAECAYKVGWLCRRSGEYGRAETWFRRSIALSRRRRDMQSRALALIGLGKLALSRGDFQTAEAMFRRALRTATRSGLTGPKAMALHDLFALAVETGRIGDAEVYAQRTARAYGSAHARLPVLAQDVAGFWASQGHFARALPVFEAVLDLIHAPAERLQLLARIGRVAGGLGSLARFTHAWIEAWRLIDAHPAMECVATALLNLAYGSAHLGDWERAELAAGAAVSLAERQQQAQIREQAGAILQAAHTHQLPEAPGPRVRDPELARAADVFADSLVRKLGVYAGVVQGHPRIPF